MNIDSLKNACEERDETIVKYESLSAEEKAKTEFPYSDKVMVKHARAKKRLHAELNPADTLELVEEEYRKAFLLRAVFEGKDLTVKQDMDRHLNSLAVTVEYWKERAGGQ